MADKGVDVALEEVKVVKGLNASTAASINLSKYPGTTAAERIEAAIKGNSVLIVGKTWCPFCIEARRTFDRLGVNYADYNINDAPEGGAVHRALKAQHRQTTVPYVFIGGELLGGCSHVSEAAADGRLETLLRSAGCAPISSAATRRYGSLGVLEGRSPLPGVLFSFPEAADDRAVRLTSFWVVVICLLCAIYYTTNGAHWTMCGLMVDYVVRLVGGGNLSPLGSLSAVFISILEMFGSKPQWVAGPPKQFAALCGLMFSALATLFFLCERYNWKLDYVGLAFTCALGAAALLESALGFCLGCFFFELMVRFGLISDSVYRTFTTIRPEVQYSWEDMNKRLNEPKPQPLVYNVAGTHPLAVDYKTKDKTDDYRKEDFHMIKHVKMPHFLAHMGLVGLACAWKLASQSTAINASEKVWWAIAIGAAMAYWFWALLYIAKILFYGRRVSKEFMSHVAGNTFGAPLITLVLMSYLVYDLGTGAVGDNCLILAKCLFWLGAPTNMALSLWQGGTWLAVGKDIESINASWMILPVGNFVAAMIGPMIDPAYLDAMQFWFGYAFMSWVLLFAITFYKAVVHKDQDDRQRPLLGGWVAAPAVMAMAYLSCYLPGWQSYMPGLMPDPEVAAAGRTLQQAAIAPDGTFQDFIFINLNWFAVALSLVFLAAFYQPFFGRIRFDMAYWGAAFPADALAFVTLTYHGLKPGRLSGGIAIAALAAASAINATLGLQTIANTLRRRVFVPDVKWGPLSLLRLTHEAFKFALPHFCGQVRALAAAPTFDAVLAEDVAEGWRLLKVTYEEHAKHEDQVTNPADESIFPGVTKWHKCGDEHRQHDETVNKLSAAVVLACAGGSTDGLVALADHFANETLTHMRHEEDVQTAIRRFGGIARHKDLLRKIFDLTEATAWNDYFCLVLNNLPMLVQRVRFVKALLWAMPERCQEIGMKVALAVDEVQWYRITAELPEIIPKHAHGWRRYL